MRVRVPFLVIAAASAHYIWLEEDDSEKAVMTFGEKAGVPGPYFFLQMVSGKVELNSFEYDHGLRNLSMVTKNVSTSNAELVADLHGTAPFRLQLAANFGIFGEDPSKPVSLLKYWCSADRVTKPNDWMDLQYRGRQSGLEITLRDPYMTSPGVSSEAGRQRSPGDQCDPGEPYSKDGAACVVAVVRFNGELLSEDMNVTTFAANGTAIGTAFSPANMSGVLIVKVPFDASKSFTPVFARVNYRQKAPGEYDGQKYEVVDHWATTYARIARVHEPLVV